MSKIDEFVQLVSDSVDKEKRHRELAYKTISFDISGAWSKHAAILGKTIDQLSDAEKQQAILNEVLAGNK